MNDKHTNKLQAQLEARKPHRKLYELGQDIPGIADGKIVFEVLRNSGMTRALVIAYRLRDEDSTGKDEKGKKASEHHHPAIADNEKHFNGLLTIATLYVASRDADDPDALPAFPSARWMRDNLQNHELDYLIHLYNKFVGEVYPGGIDKLESTEKLLNFVRMVAANWKNDIPDVALANFSHEALTECFIRLCAIWADTDQENTELRTMNESLIASGVVPKDEESASENGDLSVYAVRLLAETATTKQGDIVNLAAYDIVTKQQAIVAMRMLGWSEKSRSWQNVIADA
jgi:hypothetical protein